MILLGNVLRLASGINTYRPLLNSCRQNVPLYNSCASVKTLEEKIGLPAKPKKPLTPYFRYMKEMRPTILSENPKASTLEVVKIIAKKWETVDEAIKKKLQEEYKKDQMLYVDRRAKYDSKISPEQKNEIKQLKQEKVDAKEKREVKKRVRQLGRPKRPGSAFLKFLSNERIITPQGKDQTYRDWQMKAAEKWARMSETEKDVLIKDTRKDMEKYKLELSKWEGKMIRLGHIDVVRNECLIDPTVSKPKSKTAKTQ